MFTATSEYVVSHPAGAICLHMHVCICTLYPHISIISAGGSFGFAFEKQMCFLAYQQIFSLCVRGTKESVYLVSLLNVDF